MLGIVAVSGRNRDYTLAGIVLACRGNGAVGIVCLFAGNFVGSARSRPRDELLDVIQMASRDRRSLRTTDWVKRSDRRIVMVVAMIQVVAIWRHTAADFEGAILAQGGGRGIRIRFVFG